MWGNVFGPIPEDTKDHNFESTLVSILKKDRFDYNIVTRDMCRQILGIWVATLDTMITRLL